METLRYYDTLLYGTRLLLGKHRGPHTSHLTDGATKGRHALDTIIRASLLVWQQRTVVQWNNDDTMLRVPTTNTMPAIQHICWPVSPTPSDPTGKWTQPVPHEILADDDESRIVVINYCTTTTIISTILSLTLVTGQWTIDQPQCTKEKLGVICHGLQDA